MYNKRTNNRSSVDKQNATDTEGNSNRPLSKMVAEQMFVNDTLHWDTEVDGDTFLRNVIDPLTFANIFFSLEELLTRFAFEGRDTVTRCRSVIIEKWKERERLGKRERDTRCFSLIKLPRKAIERGCTIHQKSSRYPSMLRRLGSR